LKLNGKYAIKHTTSDARCIVKEIVYKINVNTLHRIEGDEDIGLNEIARVKLRTTKPLFVDRYTRNRTTGSMILIDEGTNETLGAGMIL
jgi:sulfate adenylyltransferase subunit 1